MIADQRDLTQAILAMRQEQQQTDMGNESIQQESPTSRTRNRIEQKLYL